MTKIIPVWKKKEKSFEREFNRLIPNCLLSNNLPSNLTLINTSWTSFWQDEIIDEGWHPVQQADTQIY